MPSPLLLWIHKAFMLAIRPRARRTNSAALKPVLEVSPIFVREEVRVRGHVFVCLLAFED